MEDKFRAVRDFLLGGCLGVTVVNIGKIIVNYIENMYIEETSRIIPILISLFFLFGIAFVVGGHMIKTYINKATIEERIEQLKVQRLTSLTLFVISVIMLIATLQFGDKIYIIASGMLSVTFIGTELMAIFTLKWLRKVLAKENKEEITKEDVHYEKNI